MRDRAGGVAHAVELVRFERLEHMDVEAVVHVVELAENPLESGLGAVRRHLALLHQLDEVLVLAEPADVIEVRMGEEDLVDAADALA